MDASIQDKIVDRLHRQGRGNVFTPKDFLDIGSRDAADQSLSRLVKAEGCSGSGAVSTTTPVNERLGIAIRTRP